MPGKIRIDWHSPNISSQDQAKIELKGSRNYQEYASMICPCIDNGNRIGAGVMFGFLTDDDHIEDMICTCRGNIELMYVTL